MELLHKRTVDYFAMDVSGLHAPAAGKGLSAGPQAAPQVACAGDGLEDRVVGGGRGALGLGLRRLQLPTLGAETFRTGIRSSVATASIVATRSR